MDKRFITMHLRWNRDVAFNFNIHVFINFTTLKLIFGKKRNIILFPFFFYLFTSSHVKHIYQYLCDCSCRDIVNNTIFKWAFRFYILYFFVIIILSEVVKFFCLFLTYLLIKNEKKRKKIEAEMMVHNLFLFKGQGLFKVRNKLLLIRMK